MISTLLVSNLITLALLVLISSYYRVPQKAYRRIVVESRITVLSENFESNRLYSMSRDLFDLYGHSKKSNLVIGDSQISLVNWNEFLPGQNAVGRGIPGDTVGGLSHRIKDYEDIEPETSIVLIGTNDVLTDRPVSDTESAYRQLIQRGLDIWPNTQIVLVSVPPFSSWVTQAEAKNKRVLDMNIFLSNLADQSSLTVYLNLHDSIVNHEGYLAGDMTMDGVHLNAAAYVVLRELLTSLDAM